MRVKILTIKTLTQSRKNALLLILVRLAHVVHAMNQDHDPRHRARHANATGLGHLTQIFVYRDITF